MELVWLALSLRKGMGPMAVRREVERHGCVQRAWLQWVEEHPSEARRVEQEVQWMRCWARDAGVSVVGMDDARYPALLLEISDAPLVLFGMGAWPDRTAWSRALAVVGTRRCSAQGARWAQEVARDWSMVGGRVVSGLARGVDMAAHRATEPGQAVAVLPCGLDAIHPTIHRHEAMRMVEDGGLLLSEQPPQARVERWMFASRNRITTGLCPATVLVESPARGCSLISAASAVDQNRELYVFDPPSQGPRWSGNRNLLADGVGWAVRDEGDLWRAMAGDAVRGAWRSPIPAACRPLWACLSAQSTHSLSGLARRLGWQEEVVRRRLNALQALGLVSRLPGRRYLRS